MSHAFAFSPTAPLKSEVICIPLGVIINYDSSALIPQLMALGKPRTFTPENLIPLFRQLESDYGSVLNRFKRGEIAPSLFHEGIKAALERIAGTELPLSATAISDIFNAPLKRNDANIAELKRLIESSALSQIAFISYSNPENIGKILRGDFNTSDFTIDEGAVQVSIGRTLCPLYVTHLLKDVLEARGSEISEHDRLVAHVSKCVAPTPVRYCSSMKALTELVASRSATSSSDAPGASAATA